MDLSLQDSGPFLCEGGSSKPTKPPGYGPVTDGLVTFTGLCMHTVMQA